MSIQPVYEVLASLSDLREPLQKRRNLLNKVAEGAHILTVEDYAMLQEISRQIRGMVWALAQEFLSDDMRRVMGGDTITDGSDRLTALPERLETSYSVLVSTAFGWGTPKNDSRHLGKAEGNPVSWRTSTGKETTGAAAKSPKRFGAGKRVVMNEAAFQKKIAIDKKLRRVSIEIEEFLKLTNERVADNQCTNSQCNKFGDMAWQYCPRCGSEMEVRER